MIINNILLNYKIKSIFDLSSFLTYSNDCEVNHFCVKRKLLLLHVKLGLNIKLTLKIYLSFTKLKINIFF